MEKFVRIGLQLRGTFLFHRKVLRYPIILGNCFLYFLNEYYFHNMGRSGQVITYY